ncbi:MAG: hypothetical protein ACXV3E_01995 [Halobacteriota archaeon]
MKQILVMMVLAVLLLATAGATTAAAKGNTVVTVNVYQTATLGTFADGVLKPPVGKASFNTTSGEWTITTTKPLQASDYGLYQVFLTSSGLVKGSQLKPNSDNILFPDEYVDANGNIVASGTYTGDLTAVNTALANGGVFVLRGNNI